MGMLHLLHKIQIKSLNLNLFMLLLNKIINYGAKDERRKN